MATSVTKNGVTLSGSGSGSGSITATTTNNTSIDKIVNFKASANTTLYDYITVFQSGQREKFRPKLPSGYTEIEYIENTGTTYYRTTSNCTFDGTTVIKCRLKPNNNSADKALFGCRPSSSAGISFWNTGFAHHGGASTQYSALKTALGTNICDVILCYGYCKVNTTELTTLGRGHTYGTQPLFLFTTGNGSTPHSNYGLCRIYNFEVWHDGNVIIDLIPCKRNSDNKIGFYDAVGNTFLEPNGSTPVAGSAANNGGEDFNCTDGSFNVKK